MVDQHVPDDRALPKHQVENPRRKSGVSQGLHEADGSEWHKLGWLEHHGIPVGERWSDLPCRDGDREVPRRNHHHDSHRLPSGIEEGVRRSGGIGLAIGLQGLAGVIAKNCSRPPRLSDTLREGLPLLAAEFRTDGIRTLLQLVRCLPEDVATGRCRQGAPGWECKTCALDGIARRLGVCLLDLSHHLAGASRVKVRCDISANPPLASDVRRDADHRRSLTSRGMAAAPLCCTRAIWLRSVPMPSMEISTTSPG